jgi:hypothetical protein
MANGQSANKPTPADREETAVSKPVRNDAVKDLNFDRINRIYRMEKRMWYRKESLTVWGELGVPCFILFIL